MLVRAMVRDAAGAREVLPGDLLSTGGERLAAGALATAGAGTWTGAIIATGIIYRTGPVGGYTDTTDTSTNIILALLGSGSQGSGPGGNSTIDVVPGTSFRLLFINTVAQALTFAAGVGVVAGTGTLDVAASLTREYLVTILNATPQILLNCATTNGSAVVTFNLTSPAVSLAMGLVTPGMTISGTGVTAGTTVLGVTQGIGGITGITMSANATATTNPVGLTFLPTVRFDSLRAGTL